MVELQYLRLVPAIHETIQLFARYRINWLLLKYLSTLSQNNGAIFIVVRTSAHLVVSFKQRLK